MAFGFGDLFSGIGGDGLGINAPDASTMFGQDMPEMQPTGPWQVLAGGAKIDPATGQPIAGVATPPPGAETPGLMGRLMSPQGMQALQQFAAQGAKGFGGGGAPGGGGGGQQGGGGMAMGGAARSPFPMPQHQPMALPGGTPVPAMMSPLAARFGLRR